VLDVMGLPPADLADLDLAIAALPILPPPRTGAEVDGFVLGRMLADGRYSRVFRARDQVGQRDVILKFPKLEEGADALLRQAFLREAWIAARLDSPWVGEVLELPPERRTSLYAALPFYPGETLEQRLRRGPRLSLVGGLKIAEALTRAVVALHRAGVIHRDIKPDNIILTEDGELRLIDLGVARLPMLEDIPATETPGTPSYMAPETLAGAVADEQSDVFALGVTIYRAFTGTYPYGEVEPFSRKRFGRPAPLTAERPDLPAWLDAVLARAIAAAPEERYGDAIEFLFALIHGAASASPVRPREWSLYARDPLRFWQCVAALLALALLYAAAR
jgi:serine/threonine protein kinase